MLNPMKLNHHMSDDYVRVNVSLVVTTKGHRFYRFVLVEDLTPKFVKDWQSALEYNRSIGYHVSTYGLLMRQSSWNAMAKKLN